MISVIISGFAYPLVLHQSQGHGTEWFSIQCIKNISLSHTDSESEYARMQNLYREKS